MSSDGLIGFLIIVMFMVMFAVGAEVGITVGQKRVASEQVVCVLVEAANKTTSWKCEG